MRHANSVFEVYRRKTPFAMGDVAAAAFSVNQLLCDAMMVNEAVRGLAHLYRPLQLVVHRTRRSTLQTSRTAASRTGRC